MLEVLQFIFSGFWVFAGTIILVATIGEAFAKTVAALRK